MSERANREVVICGTDFTQNARAAADVAAALAVAYGQPLLLVHALPAAGAGALATEAGRALRAPAQALLAEEAERLRRTGATVTEVIEAGHPDEVLARHAADQGAQLVVVGSLGARDGGGRSLGSVSGRTAESAAVATMVVRHPAPLLEWLSGARPLRVFLGFDYSAPAEAALLFVRELRRAGPVEVAVAYANWPDERERLGFPRDPSAEQNPEPVQRALERRLQARADDLLGQGTRIIVQAARGRADLAVLELADEWRADLIVTGTRQQKGVARLFTPSVSRGLLHAGRVSVVTVPAGQAARGVPPVPVLRRVLVATDFSPLANRAISHAFAIAQPGGTVRIVHVTHPLSLPDGEFESGIGPSAGHAAYVRSCEGKLAELIPDEASSLGVAFEFGVVEHEDPAAGICRDAELFCADVIVVGSQGRTALGRVVMGSVAESVLASSTSPVFIVRAPKG